MKDIKDHDDGGLTVIATHHNADFDAIASLLAAQKLYPNSIAAIPETNEPNIRNFFINSMIYMFNMAEVKKIDFTKVKRLVLVDTRQENRIGKLAELLKKPDIEVHCYDHHPLMENDVKSDISVHKETGATVTILIDKIKEKKIDLSPEEATAMCLGIYEDTGSLSYSSTTEDDLMAAAFLVSKGANLHTVANTIAREINPEQVNVLNDMLQAAVLYRINGVDVIITSISSDIYVSDIAFLVHKMMKIENQEVIFAIARMVNKIYLIARSLMPEVDAGTILSHMGGGGHKYAASATITDKTLAQTEHQLLEVLYTEIRSSKTAGYLMSSPPISTSPDISCGEAAELLSRYSINSLLVIEKDGERDKTLGYISRQVLEKVLQHSRDQSPVSEFMTTEIATVGPDADLSEIQEKIIGNNQHLLPIIENDSITGVITHTDLMDVLVHQNQQLGMEPPDPLHAPLSTRTKSILRFMHERLPSRIIDILRDVGSIARETGYSAYVVGGFVRDLFLYRENEDIDIVIEGDGIAFAKEYAERKGVRHHSHAKFGTAVIIFPDGFKLDVASARMEYYKFPASLPTVEMTSIKLDLFRRDFTINTLAINLRPENFGTLIDFFSAQKDIKDRAIRILHNLSFVEDPTRVFRAIRFEQRFNFSIGKLTAGLIKNAVKMDFFKRLSGKRVFSELRQILEEDFPLQAFIRMNDFDLLQVIHPSIKLDKHFISLFDSVNKVLSWHDLLFLERPYMKWAVYFMALIAHFEKEESEEICHRLELAPRHKKLFCQDRFNAQRCLYWLEQQQDIENSVLHKELHLFNTELILFMMAAARKESVKKYISFYHTTLRNTNTIIQGKDLKEMGIKPGPVYQEILKALMDAKLNSRLETKKEEVEFVCDYMNRK